MSPIPESIISVDVETTGLSSEDRVVTLGAWRVKTRDFLNGNINDAEYIYLIFNPNRKCHPRAAAVHGYSDWMLLHQQGFVERASSIREFLRGGEVVVAHNASFDLGFINRELQHADGNRLECDAFCTMQGYRRSGLQGRASLNAICQSIGLQRQSDRHGALEDAWLALMVYMWLHNRNALVRPLNEVFRDGRTIIPSNFKRPPERTGSLDAIIAPQPPATGGYRQSEARGDRAALLKASRPMAVLLLEIARSDDHLASEEIELLCELIDWTCERLKLNVASSDRQDVMAEIYDFQVSQNILTRSARAIYQDDSLREIFPTWFARMATADGVVTAAERQGIDRVKAAFRRVI